MSETVVIVAIAILTLIFTGSLVALIFICHDRYCRRDFFFKTLGSDSQRKSHEIKTNEMELDDVQIHPMITKILTDTQWIDDVTGLIPHCLAILKNCHHLTERLVSATLSALRDCCDNDQQRKWYEVISIAQRISPRVDDVVQSMYPPLDVRLLESRMQSLILSVTQLALIIKFMCNLENHWIEQAIADLENQLKILKEVGSSLLDSNGNPISSSPGNTKNETTVVDINRSIT